jgi:hypothetical protein
MELSTLPETSRVDVELNRSVVGGKSWALRMETRGCTEMVSVVEAKQEAYER